MKRMTQLAAALLVSAAMVACSTDRKDQDRTAADRPNAAAVGTSGVSNADRDFIADQMEDGRAEVELGRLAQERASNPQVKEFAAMMVQDHTKAGQELHQFAMAGAEAGKDMKMEELNSDHKNLHEDLAKLSGADFDHKYIEAMVKEHKEAVDELKEKADDSNNSDVKQWAAKTLPTVQQHLEHAQRLQDSLNNAKGARDHK